MNSKIEIPELLLTKANTTIQTIFTSIFAYVFINIYKPFGSSTWYEVDNWQFRIYSGLLVLLGMVVVVVSRIILLAMIKRRQVKLGPFLLFVAGEIIFMGALYALFERIFLNDHRHFIEIWFLAIQNTSLILLIPYLMSTLFFMWEEKKLRLERVLDEKKGENKPIFIPFLDENEILRISIKKEDVIFLASDDNYVVIHYLMDGEEQKYMLRNTLKKLEDKLEPYGVIRCHRSYMVNLLHVNLMTNEKRTLNLILKKPLKLKVPVSKTYEDRLIQVLNR